MGRYYNPDEYPFFPYDLNGLIKQREYPKVNSINNEFHFISVLVLYN